MEQKIPQNPYSPATQPSENLFNRLYKRSPTVDDNPQTPLMQNLRFSDQEIGSAFTGLTLQDFRQPTQTPSSPGIPATPSAEPFYLPMAYGENQQASYWAPSPGSNGGVNGPFGILGAHQNINVGPGQTGLYPVGPYLDAGDPLELMKYQSLDLYNTTCTTNYDFSSLHGKKQSPRITNNYIPILPSTHQSNFYGSVDSSWSGLYSSQHFYQWQQQLTLENLRGKIVSLAKDQAWSSVLKLKLEMGLSEEEIDLVLLEVMDFLGDLLRNQFGNQFVQKLFVACNEEQRTRIIMAVTDFPYKLVAICLNPFGARAMQKLLEKLITPQQISLVVSALSRGAVALAGDPNAQHVIQYCVRHLPEEYNKQLFNEITNNCFKIATNKSGCCVVQSCVEHSHGEVRERLIREIIANAVQLAEDSYGNYVIQHLLGLRIEEVTAELLRRFQGYFVSLSCNKYASNVVEKFLSESGEMPSTRIIMELLKSPNASMLLVDPYGNFVIQSALSVSKGHICDALLDLIRVNAASMQSNLYGKKILAWFEKRRLHNA